MSAAHCRRNGPWTAGAGSAIRTQQRQVMDSKKQDSHPQYNSWAQDYDYMVLTIEGRFRKGFYLWANQNNAGNLNWVETHVSYNTYVAPIKLVNTSTSSENYGQCTHSGFGYTQVYLSMIMRKNARNMLSCSSLYCFGSTKCLKIEPFVKMSDSGS